MSLEASGPQGGDEPEEPAGPLGAAGPRGAAGDLDGLGPSVSPLGGAVLPLGGAVSLMITARQRSELRGLGFSDATIREMTPQEAHWLLRV